MTDHGRGDGVGLERRWAGTAVNDVISAWGRNITTYSEAVARNDPPDTIVFGGGIPDLATLPAEGLIAATRRVLDNDCAGALRYGFGAGDTVMREWLADRLNTQEDAGVTADNFLLTNGSSAAIQMVAAAFLNPGDVALVERPTYPGGMRTLRAYGAELAGVDMDDEGVLIDALDETVTRLAREGRTPKLFYTMPTLHNPTGITTTLPRREAVVDICDRHRILVVEDDAYGEIRVEGERLPSYYKVAGGEGALRLSTVSKMLAPGLRIGWITARQDFAEALTRLRFDGGMSPFLTKVVAEFCLSGDEDAHLEKMVPVYREKRDRMLTALDERCSKHATWTHPDGGFFIWMKVSDDIDPARLTETMANERVSARPGTQFFPDPEPHHYLRLCFSMAPVPEIEEGIRRLGRALDQSAR